MTNIHKLPRGLVIFTLALFLFCTGTVRAQEKADEIALVDSSLDQISAKIKRPSYWHYREDHMGASYSWTFSREDGSNKPYTTGMRVQAFPTVQKSIGEAGKEFIYSFIEQLYF